tara:strand:- start:163 stop:423 length:261 start_codon:yes stop_codon:yes gene_type:complete
MTPCDAIKQKMQLGGSSTSAPTYRNVPQCIRQTYQQMGLRKGFYAGYTTTLTMNIPYVAMYFASYESLKTSIAGKKEGARDRYLLP